MEKQMEKVMAITPDDIRKINLLIGEIDPRITKILKQFADGDADRLEMFKLRTSLLLEYNTPFWVNTKDPFMQKTALQEPSDIRIPTEEETRSIAKAYSQKPTVEYKYPDGTVLAKGGALKDVFLFRYRGSKVRENGWNPILYDHLVTITPDENGNMVVAQSAGYPKPTVGIGYDNDTGLRVPTEEELKLFEQYRKKSKK